MIKAKRILPKPHDQKKTLEEQAKRGFTYFLKKAVGNSLKISNIKFLNLERTLNIEYLQVQFILKF